MNRFVVCGLALYASLIVIDRFICNLPAWAAIVLFTLASVLMIAGMVQSRKNGKSSQ
jgi:hypothetical protein